MWLALTCAFIVLPIVLAGFGGWHEDGRSVIEELGSTLGIVALGVLALELVLTARLRVLRTLGADAAVRLHRRLAKILLSLVVAHVSLAIVGEPSRIELLKVVGDPWRAKVAVASVATMGLIGLTTLARARFGLRYSTWRLLHLVLAIASMAFAVAHTVGWHRYLMHGTGVVALGWLAVTALASAGTLRLRRPLSLGRRPYVVEHIVPERGGAATIQLRADGHEGSEFLPGQFAWIKLADRPLSVAEHPFSYSSSAIDPARPSFTIRAYDGFSAAVPELAPGTRFLVDGPHGSFRLAPSRRGGGLVLVAMGIGITPCMSMLRSAADSGDRRPIVLVYGNRDEDEITFIDELHELERELDLSVVHVVSRPGDAWTGERGRISAELLERHMPRDLRGWQFFSCGSGPAVDAAVDALCAAGIPPERIHAERFVHV